MDGGWLYRRANTITESGRETQMKRRRQIFAPEAPGGWLVWRRTGCYDSALTQHVRLDNVLRTVYWSSSYQRRWQDDAW